MYRILEEENGEVEIELYEGYATTKYQKLLNGDDNTIDNEHSYVTIKDPRYLNILYTDGEINIIDETIIKNINKLPDGLTEEEIEKIKQVYMENLHINEVKFKKIILKNATYYIQVELSQVLTLIGEVHGWFWSLENMQVHIDEPTTSKTLKNVKNTIKLINKQKLNKNTNIYAMLINKNRLNHIEYQKTLKNVYQLKK